MMPNTCASLKHPHAGLARSLSPAHLYHLPCLQQAPRTHPSPTIAPHDRHAPATMRQRDMLQWGARLGQRHD